MSSNLMKLILLITLTYHISYIIIIYERINFYKGKEMTNKEKLIDNIVCILMDELQEMGESSLYEYGCFDELLDSLLEIREVLEFNVHPDYIKTLARGKK